MQYYDIACQWSKNFYTRLDQNKEMLEEMFGVENIRAIWPEMHVAIGAFHAPNHCENCRRQHDIRLVPGTGRSYGDNAEGVWGVQGRIGPSISEMGTGTREDMMNMHFDDHNHQKVVGIGKSSSLCSLSVWH